MGWRDVVNQLRDDVNDFTTDLSNGRFDLGMGSAGAAQDILENQQANLDSRMGNGGVKVNGCTENCKGAFEDATGQFHMTQEQSDNYERMKGDLNDSRIRVSSETAEQALTEKLTPKELGRGLHNVNQALFRQQAMGGELNLSAAEMEVAQQAKEMIEANGGDISQMVKEAGAYGDNIVSFSGRLDQIPDIAADKIEVAGPAAGLGG